MGLKYVVTMLFVVVMVAKNASAVPITVYTGKLSSVNQLDAAAAISATESGHGFLELLNGTNGYWHPMSFWRYILLGYPQNRAEYGVVKKSDRKAKAKVLKMNGLSATVDSSLIRYTNVRHLKEVGRINVTAWSLVYSCVSDGDQNDCYAMVPVVISYKYFNTSKPRYVELFRGLSSASNSSGYLVNSISAQIADLQHHEEIYPDEEEEGEDIRIRMPVDLQECSKRSIWAVSSPVTAAYGLPGLSCYNITGSLRSIKSRRILSDDQRLDSSFNWTTLPIQQCSKAPYLGGESSNDDGTSSRLACIYVNGQFNCLSSDSANGTICSKIQIIDSMFQTLQSRSSVNKCGISKQDVTKDIAGALATTSKWESSSGKDRTEFTKGQAQGQFCYQKSSSFDASDKKKSCSKSDPTSERCDPVNFDVDMLKASMRDTAESFVAGHAVQFNLKYGAYQNQWQAAGLTVATVLGVVMAVQALTEWVKKRLDKLKVFFHKLIKCWKKTKEEQKKISDVLEVFIRNWKDFKEGEIPEIPEKLKILLLILSNMVIGAALFSPVLLALNDQSDRRKKFETWAISTKSQTVNSYGTKYVFVTFVEGSSKFMSKQVWGWYISGCVVTVLAIAGLTWHYDDKKKKEEETLKKNKEETLADEEKTRLLGKDIVEVIREDKRTIQSLREIILDDAINQKT